MRRPLASTALAALTRTALVLSVGTAASAASQGTDLPTLVQALRWRELGPARFGGRITDFAVVESDPRTFFAATASGGVWKTSNLGTTWTPVFDGYGPASVGAVAVAPSNPRVVWVGTGEPDNRQSSSWGDGIYRSTDGGRTWEHVGLRETRHVGRIVVHPKDSRIVYVAALGHLWGPNRERGVFRTTDGGGSWENVLFIDEETGAVDLVMDPQDPLTLFAGTYQRRRTPWGFDGGGPGSGIYRSFDGGDSWTRLQRGLPETEMGRIGLDVYRRDANLAYATVEAAHGAGGLYRSTDRGDTWEKVSDFNPRPMYFSLVRVDPNDPKRVFVGGRTLSVSENGGRDFRHDVDAGGHSDHHALWIDPSNSKLLLLGTDGGVYVSFDAASSWRMLDNLPIGQFYSAAVDMRDPYWICGGLQDNGTWCGPSASRYGGGIGNGDWVNVGGADGLEVAVDPSDHRILYAESQGGSLHRVDLGTGERKPIRPRTPPGGPELRWNWHAPLVLSTHDPSVLYLGAQLLFRSADRGTSWQAVSPDLTFAIDRSRLPIVGTPPDEHTLSLHDGVSHYGTLTAIAESPLDADLLYAGTDDGRLQRTRDGGKNWADLASRLPGLPEGTPVSGIVAARHSAGRVYVTFDAHANDDYRPLVFRSDDYGDTWRAITRGLPDWSVNTLAEHPRQPGLLFLGNEIGAYVSLDDGEQWWSLGGNMPSVPVDDLVVHPRDNDLVAATHGRGLWLLEDLAPLESLTRAALSEPARLFPVRRAVLFNYPPSPLSHREGVDSGPRYWNSGAYAASNPPRGARIRYALKGDLGTAGADDVAAVAVAVLDAEGTVLRRLEGPAHAGLHEILWDLRLEAPETDGRPTAPRVLPGTYRLRLDAGPHVAEQELEVVLDPSISASRADLEARQEALADLQALLASLDRVARATSDLTERVTAARERAATAGAPVELRQDATDLKEQLRGLHREATRLHSRTRRLFTGVDGAHLAPRPDEEREVEALYAEVRHLIERLNRTITTEAAVLGKTLEPYLGWNQCVPFPARPSEVADATAAAGQQ